MPNFNYQITCYRKNEFAQVQDYKILYDPVADIKLCGKNFVYVVKPFNQETYDWITARGQQVIDSFNTQEPFVERQVKVAEDAELYERPEPCHVGWEAVSFARLSKETPAQSILDRDLFESWPLPEELVVAATVKAYFNEVD